MPQSQQPLSEPVSIRLTPGMKKRIIAVLREQGAGLSLNDFVRIAVAEKLKKEGF